MHKCCQKECGFIEVIDPNAGKAPPAETENAVA
jgi:hypothetical protein